VVISLAVRGERHDVERGQQTERVKLGGNAVPFVGRVAHNDQSSADVTPASLSHLLSQSMSLSQHAKSQFSPLLGGGCAPAAAKVTGASV